MFRVTCEVVGSDAVLLIYITTLVFSLNIPSCIGSPCSGVSCAVQALRNQCRSLLHASMGSLVLSKFFLASVVCIGSGSTLASGLLASALLKKHLHLHISCITRLFSLVSLEGTTDISPEMGGN